MRSDAMPSLASSWQSPTCPPRSEFHCASTTTARRGRSDAPPAPFGLAGKYRARTRLFSGCGVVKALGNSSMPASPGDFRSSGDGRRTYSLVGGGVKNASVSVITSSIQEDTTARPSSNDKPKGLSPCARGDGGGGGGQLGEIWGGKSS